LCCLSLLLVGAVSSALATVQVQFFDTNGNLITGASLDAFVFDHAGNVTKVSMPTEPDGTYDVPVNLGQKVTFFPHENGVPTLTNEHVTLKLPNTATGPVPVVVPLQAPANDDCSAPQALGSLPASVTSTTVGATGTIEPFCGTSDTGVPDVWYSFTGTGNDVIVSLCPANGGSADYDSKLGVYCDNCVNCVDGNDDFCDLASEVTIGTTLGETYHVSVHGFGGQTGNFTLTVTDTGSPSVGAVVCPEPPEAVGACCNCIPNAPENCTVETESDCADLGGTFQGDLTSCLFFAGGLQQFHASPGLPIPEPPNPNAPFGVSSTINVPVNQIIGDLNVNIGITHTWQADIVVTLTHQDTATTQTLWMAPNGCTSGDNLNATADDGGTAATCAGIGAGPIHSVFYDPTAGGGGPLAVFNGEDVFGDWTLTVFDVENLDTGTLTFWGIDFLGVGVPVCTVCGDGVVDTGEECDDGNQTPFDGCTQCQTDPFCGDGEVTGSEECEPPNTPTCDANCNDVQTFPVCGNGVVEPPETCEPPNTATCNSCCQTIDIGPVCGNGVLEAGEQCDDGNTNPNDGCTNCVIDQDDHGHDDHGHDDDSDDSSDDNNNNNSTQGCNSCGVNHSGSHAGQVTLCHNAGSYWWWLRDTVHVQPSSLPNHCAHGDTCGECGSWWHNVDAIGGSVQPTTGIQGVSREVTQGDDVRGTRERNVPTRP
jgi:cysteine-rich repeat protein